VQAPDDLAMPARRRFLPHDLIGLVELKPEELQVFDDPLGEHLAGVVGGVLLQNATQRSRLRLTAKPIKYASWSRNEARSAHQS
jgi:hypothetical protein